MGDLMLAITCVCRYSWAIFSSFSSHAQFQMGRPEDLVALDEEVNSLEVHIQEVEAGKRAIESLDAEAAEAAEAAQRVADRVSAEERKKAQLEQRGAGLSAASRDPVALKRTLVVLRKRNKALQHLHSTCSGSAVPLEPQARTQTAS